MPPKISIVLVNWNGKADTLECLASLRTDQYPNKEIIVVDNGSTDDSVEAIRTAFSETETTVLETGRNTGFTGGNNFGIRSALENGADYIFLLNNDTTVEPTTLTELVAAAQQHERIGVITPVIHYFDEPEQLWFAGAKINYGNGTAVHDNSDVPGRDAKPQKIAWATGCAMLIPREVMQQLKGFDERYYLNWEDVDLSLRVKELGYGILMVPAARIFHKVGRSIPKLAVPGAGLYYSYRNNLLLIRLHRKRFSRRATVKVIVRQGRDVARRFKRRDPHARRFFLLWLHALRDHFLQRYGAKQ